MLQVRENEILLRKWSDGAAHLRTLEGTLVLFPSVLACVRVCPNVLTERVMRVQRNDAESFLLNSCA